MNDATPNAGWRRAPVIFGLIALATIFAYQPAWHGGPVFDDADHLTPPELSSVRGLGRIWTELGAVSQYYPVTHSAFWLQHRLWGDAMLGYHLVNILLHIAAAGLLFAVLRRLAIPGAALAAAIFALHPVHAESVAWISEQKNTLSAVFYLAAALVYLRFDAERRPRDWWLALLLFVTALLSKSVTATLPAALLVVLWWRRGTLSWQRDARPLLPFFGLAIAAGVLTAWMERTFIGAQGEAFALTWLERLLVAGRVGWFYLGKLLWPVDLIFIYPRWEVNAAVAWQYLFPLATLGALAAAWRFRDRSRAPLAALLFFGGTLVPVLGFLNVYPFVYSFVADHYQYLASVGIITALAAGCARAPQFASRRGRMAGHLVCGSILGLLAMLTWRQSGMYRGAEILWRTTIDRNPASWVAHSNLGNHLLEQGRADEAIRHGERALELRPQNAETQNNLGNAWREKGDADRALACYQKALALRPDLAPAHYNAGVILLQRGERDAALQHFEQAVALRPEFVKARNNLGSILLDQGRLDEAVMHIQRALEVRPQDPDAHNNLGNALVRQGRGEEALAHYRQALQADPASAVSHHNLGAALLGLGQVSEAIAHFETALRLQPEFVAAHTNLGRARLQQQQVPQALKHFEQALRLRPDDAGVHNALGDALLKNGQVDEAFAQFQKAVALNPEHDLAHFNLGYLLLQNGRGQDAAMHFEKALAARPTFELAHYQLGNARMQTGDLEAAVRHFKQALALQPGFAEAWNDLGVACIQQGRPEEALAHFQKALEVQPSFVEAHNNLGRFYAQQGLGRQAATHYQAVLDAQKDSPDALVNLAWVFATSPEDAVRNGMRGIYLAQRANQLTPTPHPLVLRALAAAYAEAGRFDEAIGTAERALALLEAPADAALANDLKAQLALYRTGTPVRDPPARVSQPGAEKN